MKGSITTLAAIALLAGCGAQSDAEPEPAAIDCVDFTEHGLVFAAGTRAGLIAELGAPDTLIVRTFDGYGAGQDSVFTMRWNGLAVGLHKPAGGGEIVDEVRVSDNRYLRHPDAGIGTRADRIVQSLGTPAQRSASELTYVCHSHPARDDPVTFLLVDGRVVEVVFTYFMD